jgi:hypothetical protein
MTIQDQLGKSRRSLSDGRTAPMIAKRAKTKPISYKNAPEHPYKKYESHPYWKRIDKGISDLVENQDLVEREARPYIVGYLCKMLLQRKRGQ